MFGKTGWKVSEIGFGGARIGGLLAQDGGRKGSLATLAAALDAGINFYDTADMYSQGESEVLIGKAFRKSRDKVFIATQGGLSHARGEEIHSVRKAFRQADCPRTWIRRMPRGAIDCRVDFDTTSHRTICARRRRHRCGAWGRTTSISTKCTAHRRRRYAARYSRTRSEYWRSSRRKGKYGTTVSRSTAVDDARHCFHLEGISSLQIPFGILDMEALDGVFEEISKHQLGIIARGCFAGGALKGSLTEAELQASEPKWERVLKLRRLVEQLGRSPIEAALQFSLREPRIGVNIIGMRSLEQLAVNLQNYSSRPLSDEEFYTLLTHHAAVEA